MRNHKPIAVLLLATAGIGIGGCEYDPNEETVQRDVYTKLEDCIADWGSKDLCVQTLKQAEQKPATTGGASTVIVPQYIFSGPGYYPGNRAVTLDNGSMFRPSGQRAFTVNSFARSSISPSTARGGFGGAGRAAVSGFSGGG